MRKFDFFGVPPIYFGQGQIDRIGAAASGLGRTALLVHAGNAGGSGAVDQVRQLLVPGVEAILFRQRGEPTVQDVTAGLHAAREGRCDMVVGVGGGSAIDAAKAIAGLVSNGGEALDYMEVIGRGQKITRPAAPWIAVPTTAGTGAEVTRNAVIGDPDKKFKASIRSEHLLPRAVVIDPALGINVPPNVTAASGMDALCQLIESYTSLSANPITDALALKGITLAAGALRPAFADSTDHAAREEMAMAALLSGITLTNAGLGAVHGFAAPLGANCAAPHGVICAALLPPVIGANIAALRQRADGVLALARYATIGRIVSGNLDAPESNAIDLLLTFLSNLLRDLQIPPLRQFGLSSAEVPPMISLARKASSMRHNPVVLADAALVSVLEQAIAGTPDQ